ncbi:hypothetical protein HYW42_05265 [Candidatus Daviesbacteria bacterium]|nr:hypothetical protein [Candidatus Daviesbacteria bacterium]
MSTITAGSIHTQVIKKEDIDQKILMIFLLGMLILAIIGIWFIRVGAPLFKNYSTTPNIPEVIEEEFDTISTVNV